MICDALSMTIMLPLYSTGTAPNHQKTTGRLSFYEFFIDGQANMTQDEDRCRPLVVRLQSGADGVWHLYIYNGKRVRVIPLRPCTLVVRMQRCPKSGVLRGRLQVAEQREWVPFQCKATLETALQRWLMDEQQ
jgi:hypothetical protein